MEHKINALIAEKRKDYRNVVITQTILICIALVLQDMIQILGFTARQQIFYSVFLLLGAVYYYMLWDLLKNFLFNKRLLYALLVILIADFCLLFTAEFPFGKLVASPLPYLTVVHCVLISSEVIIMVFVFKDIFTKKEVHFIELWGSVSLFLMLAITFASIYDLINFMDPKCFGILLEPGFQSFSESLYFSLVTIGGSSPSFPSISHLVRDVAAIEGVSGTLYLVILIGRIIGHV